MAGDNERRYGGNLELGELMSMFSGDRRSEQRGDVNHVLSGIPLLAPEVEAYVREELYHQTVLHCLTALQECDSDPLECLRDFLPAAVEAGLVSAAEQTEEEREVEPLAQLNDKMIALRGNLDQISVSGGSVFDSIKNEYGVHFVGTLITSQLFNERCDRDAETLQATQSVLEQDTDLRAAVVKQISAMGKEAGKQVTRNRNDFVTALELTKRWCDLTSPQETAWIPEILNWTLSRRDLSYDEQNTSFAFNFSKASLIHPGLVALRKNFGLDNREKIEGFIYGQGLQYTKYILDRISNGHIPQLTENDCRRTRHILYPSHIEREEMISQDINKSKAKSFVDEHIVPHLSLCDFHNRDTADISLRLGFLLKWCPEEVAASIPEMFTEEQRQRIEARVLLGALDWKSSDTKSLETLIPAALVSGFIEPDNGGISSENGLLDRLLNRTNKIVGIVQSLEQSTQDSVTALFTELGPIVFGALVTSDWYFWQPVNLSSGQHLGNWNAPIEVIGSQNEMITPLVREIVQSLVETNDDDRFDLALKYAKNYSLSTDAKPAIARAIVSALHAKLVKDSTDENRIVELFKFASEVHENVFTLRMNLRLQTRKEISDFLQEPSNQRDLLSVLQHIQNGHTPTVRDTEDTEQLCALFSISPIELEKMYIDGVDTVAVEASARNRDESAYQIILSELSKVSDKWREANEEGAFSEAAEVIGYEHAFRFISEATGGNITVGTSVLSNTIKFAKGWLRDVSKGGNSSFQPEQIRNILNEVTADSSNYVSGNAVSHLDAIVSADFSLKNALDRAKYTSRQDISEGFLRFKITPPLSSWEDLKYWAAFSSSVKGLFLITSPNGIRALDKQEAARFEIAGGPQLSADVELFTRFENFLGDYLYNEPDFNETRDVLLKKIKTESTAPIADDLAPIVIRYLQENPSDAADVADMLILEDHRLSSGHLQEYGRQLIRCSLEDPSQAEQLDHVIIKIQAELDKRASNSENKSSD